MAASLATLGALAWRESRTARRRLALYMSAISLGVAALVAIDSFALNVTRSLREQSRSLLGGDLAFNTNAAWSAKTDSLLDSLATHGVPIARQVQFGSMALVKRTGGTRLAQVRAVTPNYPFYGDVTTAPAGLWPRLGDERLAIVDEGLLIATGGQVGDSLQLGYATFRIAGIVKAVPGDPGLSAAIGPRVFIGAKYVTETQLVVFGSRAQFEALALLPDSAGVDRLAKALRPRLQPERVRVRTVQENERNFTQAISQLGDFLGIVGLVALLLGGVGVASGVTAYVARKIDAVAVLRCLGATSGQVLAIYAMQAAAMGLVGALAGALIGIGLQFLLPSALGDFLPVDVRVALEPRAIATGLAVGVWIALLFALRPLVALRTVSPLQAIRREADSAVLAIRWNDAPRLLLDVALAATVVGLAIARAHSLRNGLGLSAGIAVVLGVLWLAAWGVSAAARRAVGAGWPYLLRQGVANLYRPSNQTRSVMLSLGFGAFLVSTLYLVQTNLLRQFAVTAQQAKGNVVFFDVQDDQAAGLDSLLRAAKQEVVSTTPIVTMRLAKINDQTVTQLLDTTAAAGSAASTAPGGTAPPAGGGADKPPGASSTPGAGRGPRIRRAGWALRREYHSTYKAALGPAEKVIAGQWFGATPPKAGEPAAEVSLEGGVAGELGVKVGDVITWDVQGVPVATRVTSFREVNFARFEPNFFAVFSPGTLERAPKQFVVMAAVRDAATVAELQRASVTKWPNISSLDLTLIQGTVQRIVDKVSLAIRFLAVFSLAIGVPVLFAAVAATGRARVREGVLLKVLGATSDQIRVILLAEYAVLGGLGAATGMLLSLGGSWAVIHFVFKLSFVPSFGPALAIAGLMLLLAIVIGLLGGRDVFAETPMVALREA